MIPYIKHYEKGKTKETKNKFVVLRATVRRGFDYKRTWTFLWAVQLFGTLTVVVVIISKKNKF